MRDVLHSLTPRLLRAGSLCLSIAGLVSSALGQTNLDGDLSQAENPHGLSPLSGVLRMVLWSLGGTLIVIAAVLIYFRYRATTHLYESETASDATWDQDAIVETGEQAEDAEAEDAVLGFEGAADADAAEGEGKVAAAQQTRLFAPASGPAWRESMLKAFLGTCMKVNCLGRTWNESAQRQAVPSNQPDPREAELMRRLMQRWQEFHVDPETGVFLDRSPVPGENRVCIISVVKGKRTLAEVGFNAGFVIESLGRYLRNTDLVYRRESGQYHAPTKADLAAMTPGEKESLIRITEIPDPWQVMIAGSGLRH
jgi:hypothetical protein